MDNTQTNKNNMKLYNPHQQQVNIKTVNVSSAWKGVETVIPSILTDFEILPRRFLEIGVDRGYSISVMSNFFDECTGVDTFEGDEHAGEREKDFFGTVTKSLSDYKNITLHKTRFEDYIPKDDTIYDAIHIDIVHLYEPTYKCAEWALDHSELVLLHDTESFPCIKQVCLDLAEKYDLNFYNIPHFYGVGILTSRKLID